MKHHVLLLLHLLNPFHFHHWKERAPAPPPRHVVWASIPFAKQIYQAAKSNGLNPFLVAAIVRVESDFDKDAVSYTGCCSGLMQTSYHVIQKYGPSSLKAGAAYLSVLLGRFGDLRGALIAYNEGPTIYSQGIVYPMAYQYSQDVLEREDTYRSEFVHFREVIP